MINITTPSNLRLFISGNFITVARGFDQLINFTNNIPVTLPDTVSQIPPSFLISASTTVQATNGITQAIRASDSYTESLTYTYEVIEPKVVYERIPGSSCIRFIDVTARATYSHIHTIPVINNTWMTNPGINRGRVIIEKQDPLTGLWTTVGSVPLNGSATVCNLSDTICNYRTRFEHRLVANCGGTSPLIFEAIGQIFTLRAYFYHSENPYIKSVYSEFDYKYVWCEDSNYLTLETGINYDIQFTSDNIGYIYMYNSSLLDPDIPNLVYDSDSG